MNELVEGLMAWCYQQAHRVPHPGYCTGASRFGPSCYDCSGFTYMAYKHIGLTIPADSAAVANWGRTNHQNRPVWEAQPGDLMVHDQYGDPYHSTGPRGHIGIMSADRKATWESAGSGKGAGIYNRSSGFWILAVRHPAINNVPVPQPIPIPQGDPEMYRLLKGDKFGDVWLTNWLTKRHVGSKPGHDKAAQAEAAAILQAGVTDGATIITWPQAYVDLIPTVK